MTPTAVAHATASYLRRRDDMLLCLIEDPETWRTLHRHALDQARLHPAESEARIILTRLAQVAADIATLAEEQHR